MTNERLRRIVVDNLIWLLLSFALASVVWFTARLDSDPLMTGFLPENVTIQILLDDGVIVTNSPPSRIRVELRAQESIFDVLTTQDIEVVADARNLALGQQTIVLQARSVRREATITNVSPQQITLILEERQEKRVPLNVAITNQPPASFEVGVPVLSDVQVLIAGPADLVNSVTEARVETDLENQRETVELNLRPQAISLDGEVVDDVSILPEVIGVTIEIAPRTDVREVRVIPNIVGEPPEGYTLTPDFSYSPEIVFISGSQELLDNLPGTVLTTPIDLAERTESFETSVAIDLPDDELVLLTGQIIQVSIGIVPQQTTRQFDQVQVEIIGLGEGLSAVLVPEQVRVVVNGPQPDLVDLEPENIRVIVDVNSLSEPGAYQAEPRASVADGLIDTASVSVLPATIDVQIVGESSP